MTAPHAPHSADSTPSAVDENQLITERREKLAAIRQRGVAFPNDFKPAHRAAELVAAHGERTNEELEPLGLHDSVGGRMMLKRVMGKASFCTLQDGSLGATGGRIQLFITKDGIGEDGYESFKHLDLGDILGAEGTLFKTKTGELSVRGGRLLLPACAEPVVSLPQLRAPPLGSPSLPARAPPPPSRPNFTRSKRRPLRARSAPSSPSCAATAISPPPRSQRSRPRGLPA
jgi:hypothetical protein